MEEEFIAERGCNLVLERPFELQNGEQQREKQTCSGRTTWMAMWKRDGGDLNYRDDGRPRSMEV